VSKATFYRNKVPILFHSIEENSLILSKLTEKDTGVYTCKGTFENITFEDYSTIFVGGRHNHNILSSCFSPSISFVYILVHDHEKISPKVWGTIPGSTVTFTCDSAENIQWFSKSLRSNEDRNEFCSRHLTISQVTVKESGYYYCYGRTFSTKSHFIARATLKVYGRYFVQYY